MIWATATDLAVPPLGLLGASVVGLQCGDDPLGSRDEFVGAGLAGRCCPAAKHVGTSGRLVPVVPRPYRLD
jgi:hypothetical protein